MKNITRYIVTDIVSIPVCRIGSKREAYRYATGAGWGVVDWYSAINNYRMPVNRDKDDKTQTLCCDEDSSAILYSRCKYIQDFVIAPYEVIDLRNAPKQAETDAIIISDACGYSIWAKNIEDIKIFVIYDENGLIDNYRLDNWNGKPYDGEVEIAFDDLQSEEEYNTTNRAGIIGTFEYEKKSVKGENT